MMRKIISTLLAAIILLSLLSACASKTTQLGRTSLITTPKFGMMLDIGVLLGSDGKLWLKGQTVADLDATDKTVDNKTRRRGLMPLTEKQQAELPEEITRYLSEEQYIRGTYRYYLISEDVVDMHFRLTLFFLKKDGRLYEFVNGRDVEGKESLIPDERNLKLISENVREICPCENRLAFILNDGTLVYETGSGDSYLKKIKEIECYESDSGFSLARLPGTYKSFCDLNLSMAFVNTKKELWVRGFNDLGLLGNGNYDEVLQKEYFYDKSNPLPQTDGYDWLKFYKVMEDVEKCFLVGRNVFAEKTDGSVWAWGANEYGTCGVGSHGDGYVTTREVITKPTKIEGIHHLKKVGLLNPWTNNETGKTTIGLLTESGELYSFGSTEFALIGNGDFQGRYDENKPFCIDRPYKIMDGVADFGNSAAAAIALKTNGDVYTWGRGAEGSIGNGTRREGFHIQFRDDEDYFVPSPVKVAENAVMINTYLSYGFQIVKSDGSVYCWGYNPLGLFISTAGDGAEKYDSTVGAGLLVFASPVKNPQISAVIGADGSVSFVPTPIE